MNSMGTKARTIKLLADEIVKLKAQHVERVRRLDADRSKLQAEVMELHRCVLASNARGKEGVTTIEFCALMPCPFCAGEPWMNAGETFYVRCTCGAMGPSCDWLSDAAARWNRRKA
jgi:hypothetical protein